MVEVVVMAQESIDVLREERDQAARALKDRSARLEAVTISFMNEINRLYAPAARSLTVEIDGSCHSVYIRFKRAKVHKTLSDDRKGAMLAIDLDARDEFVGIELVGIQSLSIAQIRRRLPEGLRKINFEQARWVPAQLCRPEAVPA
jgi:hypothetical protein